MDNIIIVNSKPFPEGYAPTTRLITYSRGLIENGISVNVLCIKPTELKANIKNNLAKGDYHGINFEYTSGITVRSNYIFLRPFYNLKGFIQSLCRIRAIKRTNHSMALLLLGPFGIIKELTYYFITRLLKIKFIQERTEYPFITQKNNLISKVDLFLYHHISCKLFDGMILISGVLADYFRNYISGKSKLLVIPIIVDPERFGKKSPEGPASDYIAYCGSMDSKKDGIDYLIDSFCIIAPKFPNLTLKMIGRNDFSGFKNLQNSVAELGLKNRILFTGRVSHDEMAGLLQNAMLLVLARPETIQAKANFPTKIGEYCATGKPIVTTKVGSITDYFIDGKNAYLAKPGNSVDFASKMEEALNDYSHALAIGAEGKKLTATTFNYNYQGKILADWLRKM
jgi:glycosyltransferase involved in cell wall biosynthesis